MLVAATVLSASSACAHFLVLKPSTDVVDAQSGNRLNLDLRFTHPMENGPVMSMDTPRRFGVIVAGEDHDLLPMLEPYDVDGKQAFRAGYTMKTPGVHLFYVEPAPYWEPDEEKLIIHYTKVVVEAYGLRRGWDALVGFPVEIEPLTRPYGLWTGNVFRGIVRKNGQPAPYATIEIEFLNEGGAVAVSNETLITQVVKADGQGVFAYALPHAGWWGFAALIDGEEKLPNPDGDLVDVELGGLLWVRAIDMMPAKPEVGDHASR